MFELSPDEWTAVRLSLQIALTATAFSLPLGMLAAFALDYFGTGEDGLIGRERQRRLLLDASTGRIKSVDR